MNLPVITVTELNRYIKSMFDTELMMQSIMISGEISNCNQHYKSGHIYFTLKDDNAAIKAVMFSRQAANLRFRPENGMKVIVRGRITVYERDGVYQVYADDMQPDGAGALAVAFEQLKKKLEAQGLFSPAHKKPIPRFPHRIGVITSPTGAAVQDIFNIISRRYPLARVVFQGVSVQGENAAGELTSAVRRFNELKAADVLIIGRGGGSAEDLWAFNDENLAREIFVSDIPVISAVGHETDFTICDFVSDMRAPTPSAAAELATPDINELFLDTEHFTDRLFSAVRRKLDNEKKMMNIISAKRNFTSAEHFFDNEKHKNVLLASRFCVAQNNYFNLQKTRLSGAVTALSGLNPLNVLMRGYGIVTKDSVVMDSVKGILPGDAVFIGMSDGTLQCTVTDIIMKNEGTV